MGNSFNFSSFLIFFLCFFFLKFNNFVYLALQVHNCYGDELGLTSDDEDYIDPSIQEEEKEEKPYQIQKQNSTKSTDSQSEVS